MNDQNEKTRQNPLDDLDIHEPAFARNPYPTYNRLREQGPVIHSQHYGGFWLLSRYEDVRQAVLGWQTFTSSVVGVTAIPVVTQRTEPQLPIELDPPLHSRYRALVNPVFSKARVEALRPTVTAIAVELIEQLIKQGGGDLVTDYAVPLSVRTLAEFTGLPKRDSTLWVAWIRRMFDVNNPADSKQASQEFGVYITDLIAARRQAPGDDFISMLIASEVEGHRLTDKELHSFCTVVFGAGFETTADAISVMLYYLAEHAEARQALAAEQQLIPTAVEEFLRYISPIQIFGRNTTQEIELHGRLMNKGDVVALSFGSANYDPTIFSESEQCLLDRTPNRHLAFGAGPHLCLGAPVARLEMALTLQEFAHRISGYKVRPGSVVKWKTRGDRRGLDTLPVVLTS
jgi:cytochrome P450